MVVMIEAIGREQLLEDHAFDIQGALVDHVHDQGAFVWCPQALVARRHVATSVENAA
jgi:hypothetical protein